MAIFRRRLQGGMPHHVPGRDAPDLLPLVLDPFLLHHELPVLALHHRVAFPQGHLRQGGVHAEVG
jgi:hypothetical protein